MDYTIEQAVEDLRAIKAYFEAESGGAFPICLDVAIKVLEKTGGVTDYEEV